MLEVRSPARRGTRCTLRANAAVAPDFSMPFGGLKLSGGGRKKKAATA
jgi:hypothetical protein